MLQESLFYEETHTLNWNSLAAGKIEEFIKIIHRSCTLNSDSDDIFIDLDLNLWLEVMIRNQFLRKNYSLFKAKLDKTSVEVLERYQTVIINQHTELLPELISSVLGIIICTGVEEAQNFANNNPKWFRHKINTLGDLTMEQSDSNIFGENIPNNIRNLTDEGVILQWLMLYPDYALDSFNLTNSWSTDGGYQYKFQYLKENYPEQAMICAIDIERRIHKIPHRYRNFHSLCFEVLIYLAQNNHFSEDDEYFWLTALAADVKDDNNLFPSHKAYWNLREKFFTFWKNCRSSSAKRKAAIYLLNSSNSIVHFSTTIEMYQFIVEQGEGKTNIDSLLKNLQTHVETGHYILNNSDSYSGYTVLRQHLEKLTQYLEQHDSDLYNIWKTKAAPFLETIQ